MDVSIEFRCANCKQKYKISDDFAGKTVRCRKCERRLEVPFPPLELPEERSAGGSLIYRHEDGDREMEIVSGDGENIDRITEHIEEHIGPIDMVFHEMISDMVHLDVHWIQPTESRPFHTLLTTGMSDRPMTLPPGLEDDPELKYAELLICLPEEWPISDADFEDFNNYWPVYWLKSLARLPHEYATWLFYGHTVPNGDPAEPFADNTGFAGWVVLPPLLAPEEFSELRVSDDKVINFFAIYPLFVEEMDFKLEEGLDALIDRFAHIELTEIVDVDRPNLCH